MADIDGVVAELGRLRSSLGSSEEEFGFLANLLQGAQLQSLVQVSWVHQAGSESVKRTAVQFRRAGEHDIYLNMGLEANRVGWNLNIFFFVRKH